MVELNNKQENIAWKNASSLVKETEWLTRLIEVRLAITQETATIEQFNTIKAPDISADESVYADFARFYKLNERERVVLLLALLPHISPTVLNGLFQNNNGNGSLPGFFPATKTTNYNGFLPSVETALFILAGNELSTRFTCLQLFEADHLFHQHHIISIGPVSSGEPFAAGQLLLAEEYVDFFTSGKVRKPVFSMDFPAKRIHTAMEWNDLVLDQYTMQHLQEVRIWLQHGHQLVNGLGMGKHLKPGYKALFYGPPGTGKTLTAGLLGKSAGIDVYKVDLSMVVSKYIGETEKNLEKVFRKAEHKNWILFFDEADALFGKRTSISDAHDKYANQEIAYLLQRLEEYNGLVILSSNMRNNVDEAFGRRLQSIIHFPVPRPAERLQLWKQSFSSATSLEHDVNLEWLAEKFEIAGGSIINVVQYATLMTLDRGDGLIRKADLWEGIRKEYIKEGKTI